MKKFLPLLVLTAIFLDSSWAQEQPGSVKDGEAEAEEEKPAPEKAEPGTAAEPPKDTELDPETQRLIEEAKQKIIRERAEKIAAEKKAREDEAKRVEAENAARAAQDKQSKLYLGALGTVGMGLNSVHSLGYGFGATMDVIAHERFGIHLGFSTGVTSTKGSQLTSGNATLTLGSGGTVGFLGVDLAAFYAFPAISNVEMALGGGVTVYKLSNSSLSFGSMLAPMILASAYFPVLPQLQAGVIWSLAFPGSSTLTTGGTDYTLSSKQSLTATSLMLSIRLSVW